MNKVYDIKVKITTIHLALVLITLLLFGFWYFSDVKLFQKEKSVNTPFQPTIVKLPVDPLSLTQIQTQTAQQSPKACYEMGFCTGHGVNVVPACPSGWQEVYSGSESELCWNTTGGAYWFRVCCKP